MAITPGGVGTNIQTSTTVVDGAVSAGPSAGDLIVAELSWDSLAVLTLDGSWSTIGVQQTGGHSGGLVWKKAVGSEGTAFSIGDLASAARLGVAAQIYQNVNADPNPVDIGAQQTDSNAVKTTSSITPGQNRERLFVGGSWLVGDQAFTSPLINATAANNRANIGGGTGGSGLHVGLWDLIVALTSGNYSAGCTWAAAQAGGIHILAIKGVNEPTNSRKQLLGVGA